MTDHLKQIVSQNLQHIRDATNTACQRAGRAPEDVRLVAVTKYAPWDAVVELAELHSVFGESRPQQLAERQPQLPDVEWHLIGQLQRNKVPLALKHASLIHSVDSLRLLERIETVAGDRGFAPHLLLQVNLTGEESKTGFERQELIDGWPELLQSISHVHIDGLMTMAAASDDPEDARPVFQELRQLRESLAAHPESRSRGLTLPELSMGMSGDFVQAIEEGATLIRIGSRLFEGIAA